MKVCEVVKTLQEMNQDAEVRVRLKLIDEPEHIVGVHQIKYRFKDTQEVMIIPGVPYKGLY